jgi:hypothetical protein
VPVNVGLAMFAFRFTWAVVASVPDAGRVTFDPPVVAVIVIDSPLPVANGPANSITPSVWKLPWIFTVEVAVNDPPKTTSASGSVKDRAPVKSGITIDEVNPLPLSLKVIAAAFIPPATSRLTIVLGVGSTTPEPPPPAGVCQVAAVPLVAVRT